MQDLHLVSHHLYPYVQRAVIVLSEKNIPHDRTYIDLANKPDWFVDLSPLGKTPVLETEGTVLFESQVIAEYLDEITPGSLHPDSLLEKARHRAWIDFGSVVLSAIGGFYNAPDAATFDKKRLALRKLFVQIESEIEGPYFAGDSFHMIDGVWETIFRYFDVFDRIDDFGILEGLDSVSQWRRVLARHPSVQNATPAGYPARLMKFLEDRGAHLSMLLAARASGAGQKRDAKQDNNGPTEPTFEIALRQ